MIQVLFSNDLGPRLNHITVKQHHHLCASFGPTSVADLFDVQSPQKSKKKISTLCPGAIQGLSLSIRVSQRRFCSGCRNKAGKCPRSFARSRVRVFSRVLNREKTQCGEKEVSNNPMHRIQMSRLKKEAQFRSPSPSCSLLQVLYR